MLDKLICPHSTPQRVVRRARIIPLANGGWLSNQAIAEILGIFKADVTVWTKRWIEQAMEPVLVRLSDRARGVRIRSPRSNGAELSRSPANRSRPPGYPSPIGPVRSWCARRSNRAPSSSFRPGRCARCSETTLPGAAPRPCRRRNSFSYVLEPAPVAEVSWINKIEVWFGILASKVIRCGNLESTPKSRPNDGAPAGRLVE